MAKVCEICGKKMGMFESEYEVSMDNGLFEGLDGVTLCFECFSPINKAKKAIEEGFKSESEVETFKEQTIGDLESIKGKTTDIAIKKAIENLIDESHKVVKEPKIKAVKKEIEEDVVDETVTIDEELYGTPLYTLHGNRGRHMFIYKDYVIIKTVTTFGSVITGNATDGEKVIFLRDCIGIQAKAPGLTIGYLQLESASGQMNNLKSGWFNENTFTYEKYTPAIREVHKYLFERLKEIKLHG